VLGHHVVIGAVGIGLRCGQLGPVGGRDGKGRQVIAHLHLVHVQERRPLWTARPLPSLVTASADPAPVPVEVQGAADLTSWFASSASSTLTSSITTRSAGSGVSGPCPACPPGRSWRTRWSVPAGHLVTSAIRLAARPVGAASTERSPFARVRRSQWRSLP